jgi:hypothetical protein
MRLQVEGEHWLAGIVVGSERRELIQRTSRNLWFMNRKISLAISVNSICIEAF